MDARAELRKEPADRVLHITRVFDAPRELVFEAWSQREHLLEWWGPRGYTMTRCDLDLRPGGAYHYEMRSPEGLTHRAAGVFVDIIPPERLSFTAGWVDEKGVRGHETLITMTFRDDRGQTVLDFHQAVFESQTSRDSHEGGWSSALELLGEYLQKRS